MKRLIGSILCGIIVSIDASVDDIDHRLRLLHSQIAVLQNMLAVPHSLRRVDVKVSTGASYGALSHSVTEPHAPYTQDKERRQMAAAWEWTAEELDQYLKQTGQFPTNSQGAK